RFSTGSTPGSAMSTALACTLGSAPKAVLAPEKILLAVLSWAWTSSPITTSQSALLMVVSLVAVRGRCSVAFTAGPIDDDRPYVVESAAAATPRAVGEAHRHLLALLPDIDGAAVLRTQFHTGQAACLGEGAVEAAAAAAGDV